MKATEFVKKGGLWVFKYALAQLSFNKDMFLVVYRYECEFVSEVEDNHGDCVFSYRDVKQIVDAFELVESHGGLISSKKYLKFLQSSVDMGLYHGLDDVNYETEIPLMNNAINLVGQCQND